MKKIEFTGVSIVNQNDKTYKMLRIALIIVLVIVVGIYSVYELSQSRDEQAGTDTSTEIQIDESNTTEVQVVDSTGVEIQTTEDDSSEEQNSASGSDNEEEYHFRNNKLLEEHFDKHGKEMGFSTAESYEKAASKVAENPDSLHKTEKDDGDDCYYLEKTNEFVIVSTDGYIRTYFTPDSGKKYYDKQ